MRPGNYPDDHTGFVCDLGTGDSRAACRDGIAEVAAIEVASLVATIKKDSRRPESEGVKRTGR